MTLFPNSTLERTKICKGMYDRSDSEKLNDLLIGVMILYIKGQISSRDGSQLMVRDGVNYVSVKEFEKLAQIHKATKYNN